MAKPGDLVLIITDDMHNGKVGVVRSLVIDGAYIEVNAYDLGNKKSEVLLFHNAEFEVIVSLGEQGA